MFDIEDVKFESVNNTSMQILQNVSLKIYFRKHIQYILYSFRISFEFC
jgi:hypothetical protein